MVVKIGQMNQGRWKHIVDTYVELEFSKMEEEYKKYPADSIPVLIDVRDFPVSQSAISRSAQISKPSPAYAVAVVGITEIRMMIASKIRRGMYYAENLTDAKEWLVKQPNP